MRHTTKSGKKYDDETIKLAAKLLLLKFICRAKQEEKETGRQPA